MKNLLTKLGCIWQYGKNKDDKGINLKPKPKPKYKPSRFYKLRAANII